MWGRVALTKYPYRGAASRYLHSVAHVCLVNSSTVFSMLKPKPFFFLLLSHWAAYQISWYHLNSLVLSSSEDLCHRIVSNSLALKENTPDFLKPKTLQVFGKLEFLWTLPPLPHGNSRRSPLTTTRSSGSRSHPTSYTSFVDDLWAAGRSTTDSRDLSSGIFKSSNNNLFNAERRRLKRHSTWGYNRLVCVPIKNRC